MSSNDDDLVADYLARLRAAATGLPADRAAELIGEISAHIAEARAADPAAEGGVRTILDQLGQPDEIVRAAVGSSWPTDSTAWSASSPTTASGPPGSYPPPQAASNRLGPLEISAVILLLVGGLVVPFIGWVVGVVLLWVSGYWRTGDKILATLVWPGGLLAPVVVFLGLGAGLLLPVGPACRTNGFARTNGGPPTHFVQHCASATIAPWLAITIAAVLLVASLAGPIVVAIKLLRAKPEQRRAPGQGADLRFTPSPVG